MDSRYYGTRTYNHVLHSPKQVELIKELGRTAYDSSMFKNKIVKRLDLIDKTFLKTLISMHKSRKVKKSLKTGIKKYLLWYKTKYPYALRKWTCKEYFDINKRTRKSGYVKYPNQLFYEYKKWCEANPDQFRQIEAERDKIRNSIKMR